jgi:hypothetical protein
MRKGEVGLPPGPKARLQHGFLPVGDNENSPIRMNSNPSPPPNRVLHAVVRWVEDTEGR